MKKLSLACAVALTSSAVLAQDNIPEEMIITGSRVLERIDEVPSSVTVIRQRVLEQAMKVAPELQNILSLRVPGMAPSTNSTSNFGQTLRGRTALVMIDGVPQSTPLRNGQLDIRSIDAGALQRIEVVKGATSVYGNGAAGGIINYITKDPGAAGFNAEIRQSTRFSTVKFDDSVGYRFSATMDGTKDRFSYVVNAAIDNHGVERDAEGDIIGLSLYGLSDVQSRSLFSKLGYQLDQDRSLGLTYTYYQAQQESDLVDVISSINDGTKTYAVEAAPGVEIPGEPQGAGGNHNLVVQYRDEQLTGNTRLSVDAYAQEIENIFFYSAFFADPAAGFEGGNSVILSEKRGLRLNLESVLNLQGVETTFIYGMDLLNDVTSQPLADGRTWVPEMDMTNRAAYLQSKWVAGDWVLKAGARREYVDIDIPDYSTLRMCGTNGACRGGNPVEGGKLSYQDTTYHLGLRFNANQAFNPFISYSQGFDVSDLGLLLRAAEVPDIDRVQTQASIIDHYEAGFSGSLGKWNYEFAAYRSESELGTATVEAPPGSGLYVPVRAPQEIWGYEMAIGYDFNEALSGGITYTWVEGKDPDSDRYLDARKIAPPKLTAFFDWQASSALNVTASYLLVTDRDRFEPVNGRYSGAEGPVESYDVFNVSAGYQWQNWAFSVGIENLFNESYFPARAQALTYNGYNTMGLGRNGNLSVHYQF